MHVHYEHINHQHDKYYVFDVMLGVSKMPQVQTAVHYVVLELIKLINKQRVVIHVQVVLHQQHEQQVVMILSRQY